MSPATLTAPAALALWVLLGCGPLAQPAPVKLQGKSEDIRRIAGSWQGEFLDEKIGREGRIVLRVSAGSDTVYGKITFDRVVTATTCTDISHPQAVSTVAVPVVLRIGGLATAEGTVGGYLEPYRDPDLACWMDTWFEGGLVRDTLRGSFFSRRTDTDSVRQGIWWAARTP